VTFKATLAARKSSPAAIFHKFRTDASIRERRHIFVEGYDDVIFYSRFFAAGALAPRFHLCLGKKNLDDIAGLFWKSGIAGALVLFLRDSDFDVALGRAPEGQSFFLTCGYAVENYVCSVEAVESYLKYVMGLDEDEVEFGFLIDNYRTAVHKLHGWLAPVYGAAMCAVSQNRKIDLNQMKVAEYFSLIVAGRPLPPKLTPAEISSIGLFSEDFNEASLKSGKEFSNLPALQWIRGKFLLKVLVVFLRSVDSKYRALYKTGEISRFNKKASAEMSEVGVFHYVSGVAAPTQRLKEYLKSL